ncbi:hypothetical protein Ancab_036878 [Ancistrocladus abbreviatus]
MLQKSVMLRERKYQRGLTRKPLRWFLRNLTTFAGNEKGCGVENGEDRVSDSDGSSGIITERYGIDSKGITEKGSVGNGSIGKNEMGNGDLECEVDELKTQAENANGLKSSGRIFRRRLGEREEAGCFGED